MLLRTETSCLLIIDIQEKLLPAMQMPEQLVTHCRWLIDLAEALEIPTLVSEQYRRGLGATVPELKNRIPETAFMEKNHFSCLSSTACKQRIERIERSQVVIAGIEAHICVLQTALELIMMGKEVFVVVDAVSSRCIEDKELAMIRMRDAGVKMVNREMVFFEWLGQAGTQTFKQLRKRFLE
jgi:nicotinamidase-related amidase